MASHNVSVIGATNGVPDFETVMEFVKKNKNTVQVKTAKTERWTIRYK